MAGCLRGGSSVWCKGRVDGVVLAERMALPVLGEQDPPELRMAREADAEHVVARALHPVGAGVEPRQRGAACLARAEARAQRHDEPGVEVLDAADDLEPRLLPSAGRRPIKLVRAELAQREGREFRPALARHGEGHGRALDRRLDAKRLPDSRARVGGRHAHWGSEAVERLPVFWNSATCSCSLSSPYISESGVGGHPGTETSTGTTRSAPLTTWLPLRKGPPGVAHQPMETTHFRSWIWF